MASTYLKKYESWVQPQVRLHTFSDIHLFTGVLDQKVLPGASVTSQYDASIHGTTGPIMITLSNWIFETTQKVMSAAGQMAGFEYNRDANGASMLGLSWAQMNQGVRRGVGLIGLTS